ncbi:uncharacterized protein BKA55DRAFT_722918 [Fusarium redolens]|uniref:Transcription factor domain-containing protein n=1 Tax=Fusarium redolens TaxID=48865 RepID=A0A9P9FWU5_FUSRE|nr:uncharacterized protein BKA55DRAFT_722918 [Fusarium redolens]KAH7205135.1 hypothetical protein BKA55DRAFT_722918 [Fusarium redolens]
MDTASQGPPTQRQSTSNATAALPVINVAAQQPAPAGKRVRRAYCPPQQVYNHNPDPTLSHDEQPSCSDPAPAQAHELSRPSPEVESDQESLDAALAGAASVSENISDPLLSPRTSVALDHAMLDANIGFPQEFWDFDTLGPSCNPPNELVAAEQLLALESPPVTEPSMTLGPMARPDARGSVGRIFGMDKLLSQPTSPAGAISSGIFHRKEKGSSQFLGFTSTAAILARCVYESRETGPRLSDSESLGFIVDSGPMCDEISCSDIPDVPRQQIPCSTLAVQYLNAFFEDTYPSHPVADQDEVRLILDRYVYNGHQSLGVLDRSILYLIMALGASSRSSPAATRSIDYEKLYALAWNLFPYAMATPSLASVQVLLLHVGTPQFTLLIAIVYFAAGTLQYPLEQLSMSQGRPPICQPSQCDTELFSGKLDLLQVSEISWPLSQVLIWKLGLARIQQKINNAFSTSTSPEQRSNCLEEADIELMKWKEELPLEFRPDQQMILDGDAHIDIYMLHLDYHNLLQMIHWSSTKHRPKASETDFAAPRMRASASICVGASLAVVRTLNAMTDANTRARSFR